MTGLEQHYRDYLTCLDERRFAELGRFVADDVVHNGAALGLSGYRTMLENDVRTFPDLLFGLDLLVVDRDQVAARLLFDCTPVLPFAGFAPTGERVRFSENVFYRFQDGRIAQVWSLLDLAALARQLPREG